MRLNVLGLVSIDTLAFRNYTQYLGGGALATAWLASLWGVESNLYSISCEDRYYELISKNTLYNKNFFSHKVLSPNKPMPQFEISENNGDYFYKIHNLSNAQNELREFLKMNVEGQYIKLPASNFHKLENMIVSASINPQGKFDLYELTKRLHTNGFIFLNYHELLAGFKLDFFAALTYIERIRQSFVITLGENGAICYDENEKKWCFCPALQSAKSINSLGCGDAFAGGFLVAHMSNCSIARCMAVGTISAYLAMHSPSNVISVWLDTSLEEKCYDDFLLGVRYFETAVDLLSYIKSQENKFIKLHSFPTISSKFNWEINKM